MQVMANAFLLNAHILRKQNKHYGRQMEEARISLSHKIKYTGIYSDILGYWRDPVCYVCNYMSNYNTL